MKRINLQLFAEDEFDDDMPVEGVDAIYLYRILKEAATEDAWGLAYTTENSTSESKDADTIVTKDGTIRDPGDLEIEISTTSYMPKDSSKIKKLRKAMVDSDLIEIWEINKAVKGSGADADKYEAMYYRGYLTSLEKSSGAEDKLEVSLDFAINGEGAEGFATLSEEQEAVVKYAFVDTEATGA